MPAPDRNHPFARKDDSFPHLYNLNVALNYPVRSADSVTADYCPKNVVDVFKKIEADQLSRADKIYGAAVDPTGPLSAMSYLVNQWKKSGCDAQESQDSCSKLNERMSLAENQYVADKSNFANLIDEDSKDRTTALANLLLELSNDELKDICDHALGAKFILNCNNL
jgi:hypothetical protein